MKINIFRIVASISILFIGACGIEGMNIESAEPSCNQKEPLCFEMVMIEGGDFMMGSEIGRENEKPVHLVSVHSFKLMQTEVTRAMYRPCIEDGVCAVTEEDFEEGDLPVGYISWNDTQTYIEWLNEKQNMNYRLPTEAEWEYAARAGTTTKYSWGDEASCSNANYWGCIATNLGGPVPVKSFAPNNFNLYDMSGNVEEWVHNCLTESYLPSANNTTEADTSCKYWSFRGASWVATSARYITPSNRSGNTSDFLFAPVGFRLAHSL